MKREVLQDGNDSDRIMVVGMGEYVPVATLRKVLEMIIDEEDRYGIGSMCSQWTGPDIAEDIIERIKQGEQQ